MFEALLRDVWAAVGGDPARAGAAAQSGAGALPSVFGVSDLAAASIAAAGLAIGDLIEAQGRAFPPVNVDRRLASLWFGFSMRPQGWTLPPMWDPVAGDYLASDGWIKLHTNAPHHRAAALGVLGCEGEREAVADAVARWRVDDLETAIVAEGGCAAALRSGEAWAAHDQGRAVAAEPLLITEAQGEGPDSAAGRADRPLAGVRVLDLTRILAGPVATRFLAGYGADVLRIDPPGWDETTIPEVVLGKRCARLDLKTAADLDQLKTLLGQADVFVHGYRADALDRLGLGAIERQALRPGLIDISLDAYGWSGPWRDRRGFDSLVQMSSGIAYAGMVAAGADKPISLPVQALDHATGYLMAAAAVRGLTERLRTGRGVTTRASLARTAALLVRYPATAAPVALAPAAEDDFSRETETSGWGPMKRLRPPLDIAGTPMRWALPAARLGSSPPLW